MRHPPRMFHPSAGRPDLAGPSVSHDATAPLYPTSSWPWQTVGAGGGLTTQLDPAHGLKRLGIDEFSRSDMTVVVGHNRRRVAGAGAGYSTETLEAFFDPSPLLRDTSNWWRRARGSPLRRLTLPPTGYFEELFK